MLVLMMMLAGDPDLDLDAVVAAARARTAAAYRCTPDLSSTDITVCGLRSADRFRVPFATHAVLDIDDVTSNRASLIHARTPMEDMGPFLVGGGMAGVHVGVRSGKASVDGLRPIAP